MLLNGIFPPITTPFYPDERIYWKKLEQNVEQYSRTPVSGIVVLGSTGEALMLSDQEKRDVFKCSISAAAADKAMIAGTGMESMIETLHLTEYAAELGYDAVMVRTPYYYKRQTQPANILTFYRALADRSPLPIMIYNFPQSTGYDIPAEVVIELAEHPQIIAIKESSGSIEKVEQMVKATSGDGHGDICRCHRPHGEAGASCRVFGNSQWRRVGRGGSACGNRAIEAVVIGGTGDWQHEDAPKRRRIPGACGCRAEA
jgi:4-hydroxy-2-oxoglutarate aldolase